MTLLTLNSRQKPVACFVERMQTSAKCKLLHWWCHVLDTSLWCRVTGLLSVSAGLGVFCIMALY